MPMEDVSGSVKTGWHASSSAHMQSEVCADAPLLAVLDTVVLATSIGANKSLVLFCPVRAVLVCVRTQECSASHAHRHHISKDKEVVAVETEVAELSATGCNFMRTLLDRPQARRPLRELGVAAAPNPEQAL